MPAENTGAILDRQLTNGICSVGTVCRRESGESVAASAVKGDLAVAVVALSSSSYIAIATVATIRPPTTLHLCYHHRNAMCAYIASSCHSPTCVTHVNSPHTLSGVGFLYAKPDPDQIISEGSAGIMEGRGVFYSWLMSGSVIAMLCKYIVLDVEHLSGD